MGQPPLEEVEGGVLVGDGGRHVGPNWWAGRESRPAPIGLDHRAVRAGDRTGCWIRHARHAGSTTHPS
jgi:hypothetical protein